MNNRLPKQYILIVDDSPVNIRILEATLISEYEIIVTTKGAEAIEIATSRADFEDAVDLILLDITMPDMDGYEVCKRLKADTRTARIPIIFITARSEEREETRGFELGAVDYIRKPFCPAVVRARVKTHLDLKCHQDNLERLNKRLKQEVVERRRSEDALKYVLKKQEVDIELAKKILNLINGAVPRYIPLSNEMILFIDTISIPCYAEGGDHYFVRNFPGESEKSEKIGNGAKKEQQGKILLSLKDQSGHEVSCLLKSIITDFIHNKILNRGYQENNRIKLEETISMLNDEISLLGIFNREDFFTAINAEIDCQTLNLRYVSAGHPPFLLIRGDEIKSLPESGEAGGNIPIAIKEGMRYSAGEYQLQKGDKLIFYTDGLIDMPMRNHNRMITLDELKNLVQKICPEKTNPYDVLSQVRKDMTVSEIMNGILKAVSEISHEKIVPRGHKIASKNTSNDDITLVGIEIGNLNHDHETS